MIKAVAYETIVRATISGGPQEFMDALELLKGIPFSDRRYDEHGRYWIIKNPENYRYIKEIDRALNERNNQMTLFQ